ncbi:calcium-binding protein, partial [Methylosoma difficile]
MGYGSTDVLTVSSFFASTAYAMGSFQFSDGLTLNNFIIGSTANDSLNGTALNDAINGLAGADTMSGGLGDDLYFVDNTGDVVTEALNAGNDTVLTAINYTLTANVENVGLLAGASTATGNSLNNVLTGNAAVNTLSGLDGNDTLDGKAGADIMTGGLGKDSYFVDDLGDQVIETSTALEDDLVTSSVTFTLGANVENLTLTGRANLKGTGNSQQNTLRGNAGNNTLDGKAGEDTMIGGLGNDTYIVDNAGDIVTE